MIRAFASNVLSLFAQFVAWRRYRRNCYGLSVERWSERNY